MIRCRVCEEDVLEAVYGGCCGKECARMAFLGERLRKLEGVLIEIKYELHR